MVEQQKRRLESAISEMIEDMYRSHLRRMQVSSGDPVPFLFLYFDLAPTSPPCIAAPPPAVTTSADPWTVCNVA